MLKIKSILMAAVIALTATVAFADVPAFDVAGAKNAFVIDAKAGKGGVKDYLQIINFTNDTSNVFTIYGHDKKEGWVKLGTSKPQPYGNSENLETEYEHKLHKYSAFAVVPANGKEYKYEFTKFVINMYVVRHFMGGIRIYEDVKAPKKDAFIVENKAVKGSFKDRIKVEGADATGKSFRILGSNDKENWEIVAGGTVLDNEEDAYLEAVNEDKVAKYAFYAIECRENVKFNYEVSKSHNDLYIKVSK
ncbi:MAG: hypothetical protein MJ188_12025 [Treponema sp.]|nr:hypothetical protein [Treponema sp.]